MRIAFVTSREAGLTQDDRAVLDPLRKLDIAVEPLVWDGRQEIPRGFDLLVLRSCWDSHRKPRQFESWLHGLASAGAPVLNPVRPMLWNLNKKYLLEMASRGARVPKTKWFPAGFALSQPDIDFGEEVRQIVVKPAVSLNGFDTAVFEARDSRAILAASVEVLKDRDLLLQEFIPEIRTVGETSLVFFSGAFSHAVRKTAKRGEFRVQVEHGGSRASFRPGDRIVDQARRLLKMIDDPLLYARVDGVEVEGELILMELEIVDPMLFLAYDPNAAEVFARNIRQSLA